MKIKNIIKISNQKGFGPDFKTKTMSIQKLTKVKINHTGQFAFIKNSKKDDIGDGILYHLLGNDGKTFWNGASLYWPESLIKLKN